MSNKLSGILTLRLPSGDNRFKAFFNVGESGFATEEYVKQLIAELENKEEGKYVEKIDIQDTLNSDNSNKPLSANQGKVLKGLLDARVIEAGAVPMDTEPTEGNINNVVSSDGLAKEFNKCNTTIINTDRIANEAIVLSKLSVDIQNLITNLSKTTTFAGIATPTTNPGTPDGPVFYLATEKGTYANFNGIEIDEGEAIILQWNNGTWTKRTSGLATEYLNKKLDVIKGVDNTDLTKGYYYDNTNGNKIVNINSYSTLIDIPSGTKEITLNWETPSINTSGIYGITLYDAYVSELTDENISSHFINGFNEKKLLEVPRIVIDSRYKSIAISSNSHKTIRVIFSPKVSSVKYGSRLIDVFYLNDSSTRSLKGKSLFLRTLNKSTGTISFRDSNSKDYNIFSTKKKGKELLICKDDNYVYLGVLVDWDIVDYDFTDVPQSEENTIVLSTPKSSEGQRIFDIFFNKKYRQTGNTTKNKDGVISEYDCVWEDGTTGHVTNTTYDDNVLEYRSSIVTYESNYAVHYGLKTFDEFGNIVSETGLEIHVV